ncbi:hypothetical protein [Frondihabitans australicus]|uniref:Uncharacterized protein n=1 Tax=Frondihabitans australicus TaxID=386892 RepID=A0A495IHJ7_9MICO|nr:hypothetical protein [Frondihabitans australicus]RKR74566.1 hypothetical protein C8E83_1685 [Frondihabitans australicus]
MDVDPLRDQATTFPLYRQSEEASDFGLSLTVADSWLEERVRLMGTD